MPVTRTIAQPLRHEIDKIKGSRFIASIEPITSTDEANAFLGARRKEFYDATHNCYAWRLDAEVSRSSDDGEPSGTAGRPILQEIESRELVGVAVVVTRYYGGTKLGTGGLIRAYSQAAAEALKLANILEIPIVSPLRLRYGYDRTGDVQAVLGAFGIKPGAADYGADVRLQVDVPVENEERLRRALIDGTAGDIEIE